MACSPLPPGMGKREKRGQTGWLDSTDVRPSDRSGFALGQAVVVGIFKGPSPTDPDSSSDEGGRGGGWGCGWVGGGNVCTMYCKVHWEENGLISGTSLYTSASVRKSAWMRYEQYLVTVAETRPVGHPDMTFTVDWVLKTNYLSTRPVSSPLAHAVDVPRSGTEVLSDADA